LNNNYCNNIFNSYKLNYLSKNSYFSSGLEWKWHLILISYLDHVLHVLVLQMHAKKINKLSNAKRRRWWRMWSYIIKLALTHSIKKKKIKDRIIDGTKVKFSARQTILWIYTDDDEENYRGWTRKWGEYEIKSICHTNKNINRSKILCKKYFFLKFKVFFFYHRYLTHLTI
jgi:hypothetical protein